MDGMDCTLLLALFGPAFELRDAFVERDEGFGPGDGSFGAREEREHLSDVRALHAARERDAERHKEVLALAARRLADRLGPPFPVAVGDGLLELAGFVRVDDGVDDLLKVVVENLVRLARGGGLLEWVREDVQELGFRLVDEVDGGDDEVHARGGEGFARFAVRRHEPALRPRRLDERHLLLLGQRVEVLAVHPRELLLVKDGGALRDAVERKGAHELLRLVHLLLRAVVPPEEAEEVDHGGCEEALLLKVAHRGGAVPLRELAAVGGEDEGHVAKLWHGEPERVVHEHLPQRVGQVLLRAEHVSDPHERVVHRHAEVVDWQPVRAQEDKVAERVRVPRNLPAHLVLDGDHLVRRHPESVRVRSPLGEHLLHLLRRSRRPLARVLRGQALRRRLLLHRLQLLIRAKTRVRLPLTHKLLRQLLVNLRSLRLTVRTALPAHVRSFVPIQPKPLQIANHRLLRLPRRPSRVRVLNPQHKLAARPPRVQPVEEGCAGATDVQVARRARSEPHTHLASGLRRHQSHGCIGLDSHRPCCNRSIALRSCLRPRRKA
mmetsp:Transcript_30628/g.99573  ORF Transcript_30628/g.99573 Transcript_30628/m.99573 type:complete len:549 (+) Transcript_30628:100-1746(+)